MVIVTVTYVNNYIGVLFYTAVTPNNNKTKQGVTQMSELKFPAATLEEKPVLTLREGEVQDNLIMSREDYSKLTASLGWDKEHQKLLEKVQTELATMAVDVAKQHVCDTGKTTRVCLGGSEASAPMVVTVHGKEERTVPIPGKAGETKVVKSAGRVQVRSKLVKFGAKFKTQVALEAQRCVSKQLGLEL